PAHDEMQVDLREHFGIGVGTHALDLDLHVADGVPAFLEDVHDVDRRARAHRHQHQLHGPRAQVAAADVRRAVDDDGVAAAGFHRECGVLDPFDAGFHGDFL